VETRSSIYFTYIAHKGVSCDDDKEANDCTRKYKRNKTRKK